MTKVKDALNQEYTFTYDQQGRVLTQTRNGTTMTFTYDAVGNRATRTDYNGYVTSHTYDDLNRLTNVGYTGASGENASYTYDDLSRLLTAVNAAGTVTFTYDNRGRLKTGEDVFGHDLEYTYDAAGRRTLLKLDTANHTGYAYDNANRLTTLTDESSNNFTFGYDNANRLTSRVMPNGVTSTYTYDDMSRLKRLKHENTSTTLYDDQFTYNTANQISQIAGLAATKNYTYDNINRLTAVTVGGSTVESYTYDAVGNRTASHLSSSYTTGAFNRVTATDLATYTYNANGSTTGKTVGSTSWTNAWDRENRMTSAGDGTNTATYQYDALGRRVKRTQGSYVEKYTNDGQDVVLDDVNSTLTKYQNGPGIDNKQKLVTGGTSKYFLQDHLGSSIALVTSGGSVSDSNAYDSFGNATNGSFSNRYQYTGRELDPVSGISYYRARFYDQNVGRFASEDPIGFGGGDINLYGYVWNAPTNLTDPTGWGPFKLPSNPGNGGSNLPKSWRPVPEHKGGERWVSPGGDEGVEFHPGRPGKPGYEGQDHWHTLKPGKNGKLEKEKTGGRKGGHYLPGDEVDLKRCACSPNLSQPSAEELKLNEEYWRHMERFWTTVAVGGAAVAVVVTGGAIIGAGGCAVEAPTLPWLVPVFGF